MNSEGIAASVNLGFFPSWDAIASNRASGITYIGGYIGGVTGINNVISAFQGPNHLADIRWVPQSDYPSDITMMIAHPSTSLVYALYNESGQDVVRVLSGTDDVTVLQPPGKTVYSMAINSQNGLLYIASVGEPIQGLVSTLLSVYTGTQLLQTIPLPYFSGRLYTGEGTDTVVALPGGVSDVCDTWPTYIVKGTTLVDAIMLDWPKDAIVAPDGSIYLTMPCRQAVLHLNPKQTPYSIAGRVSDGNSNPIAGVTISAGYGISSTTDATGNYTITGIVSGTYTLTPSKSGYSFSPTLRTLNVPPSAVGQNFYGLAAARVVDPLTSTVEVSSLFVEANGVDSSAITVTLKTAAGAPVGGKMVQLISERGGQDIITQPANATNAFGIATSSVRSMTAGSAPIWAWVSQDGIRLSGPITFTFGTMGPVPDPLRYKANATANRAADTLHKMLADDQAVVDEAIYIRGAVGEYTYKLSSDMIEGALDTFGGLSDWNNGVLATRYTYPGWDVAKNSPAWASPAVCKISSAFMKDATSGIGNQVGQRAARLALGSGLYLLTAQKNNECLGDLRDDLVVDSWNIANLLIGHLERPLAEWPVKKLTDDKLAFQQSQINRLNNVRIPQLTQSQIDAYVADLNARANALDTFHNRLQDARWTLESIHQANAADPWGGQTIQMILRLSAKGIGTYFFDGAGQALVSGSLGAFDAYMDANALSESVMMAAVANATIAKTAPEAIASVADTIAVGFDQVIRGQNPSTPQGSISNIQHFSEGNSDWHFGWNEKASYSTVTVRNTGGAPATYQIISRYLAQTTRLSLPWAYLWMHSEANPVTLAPGESRTVQVDYLKDGAGYSPHEGGWGAQASPIEVVLQGLNQTGTFNLASVPSSWNPSKMTPARPDQDSSVSRLAVDLPTIDAPLMAFVG
ncbi:MAG: invasin domain 3-containing protein, partial [Dehalococcoidia bacterium]|nr:invasin domain 3-containing protein [Dehalococcoidia bacterium]